jgi:anti-sigma regulatory factor (Ser/Thr protein kinase)
MSDAGIVELRRARSAVWSLQGVFSSTRLGQASELHPEAPGLILHHNVEDSAGPALPARLARGIRGGEAMIPPNVGVEASRVDEPPDPRTELVRLTATCRRQSEAIDGLGRRCLTLRRDAMTLADENSALRAALDRLEGNGLAHGSLSPRRHPTPGAGDILLPAEPRAPGAARMVITHWLRGQCPEQVVDDARLVISELVTNSVRHAGMGPDDVIRLRIELTHGGVRVQVEDPGGEGVIAPRSPDLNGGGGMGLNIVVALATRWGVVRDRRTRVWAELTWSASS